MQRVIFVAEWTKGSCSLLLALCSLTRAPLPPRRPAERTQALRKCVKRATREVSKQNSGKKTKPLEHFALPFTHINERVGATLTHQMLLAAEPDYTSIATLCDFALLSPLERLLWASDPAGRSFAALERMSAHDVINTAIIELSALSAKVTISSSSLLLLLFDIPLHFVRILLTSDLPPSYII